MANEDIVLEARGDASDLKEEFEGAQAVVEQSMDGAQAAIEGVDPSALTEAGTELGDALADGAERAGDALDDLASDLDATAAAAEGAASAGTEAAQAQDEIQQSADGAASAVRDLADADDALAKAQKNVAESAEAASMATKESADAADLLSDATRRAADAGSEAGQRIRDALSAVAESTGDVTEGVSAAERAFEALGGSPTEFISATNSDLEKQVVLLADLEKNLQQLDEESREGLGGFADRAAKVSQRMRELDRLIEKQGDESLPQVRQELERLRTQFRETFDEGARRAANLETEIEQQEDALKRMQLEARGSAGEIFDLTEAVRLRFPAAAKGIGTAVSALAAFTVAFQGTREFIEFLERDFGIGVDAFITRVAGLEDVAAGIVGASGTVREELERIGNQLNILERTGTDVSELRREYESLQAALKDASGTKNASGTLNEFLENNARTAQAVQDIEEFVGRADAAFLKVLRDPKASGDRRHRRSQRAGCPGRAGCGGRGGRLDVAVHAACRCLPLARGTGGLSPRHAGPGSVQRGSRRPAGRSGSPAAGAGRPVRESHGDVGCRCSGPTRRHGHVAGAGG